jgi:peptide-methionine (R)-S-oxide reductase
MKKSAQNWRKSLTEEEYKVTRCGGTEQPFSGKYYHHKEEGIYQCIYCGADLFHSASKYDSGSGWPSFYDTINDQACSIHRDTSLGMIRNEVKCPTCDAHLGHVFPDGPPPTGLRYCINSLSLNFKATTR